MKLFLRLPACEEARGKAQDADALRVSQEAWRPGSELRVQTEVQKDPLVSSLRPHSLSFLFSFPASPVVSLEIWLRILSALTPTQGILVSTENHQS